MMICAKTDIGKVRKTNEDCYDFEVINEEIAWALVCDGMGGTEFGEIASNMAKSVVRREVGHYLLDCDFKETTDENIKNKMIESLKLANKEIFKESLSEKYFNSMGTTAVLAVVCRDILHVVHVGDSRAYLISKENVERLTQDHSVVEELVKSGKITDAEAKTSPQKNIITRALGVNENVEVDYTKLALKKDDNIFLCTDGLSNYIEPKELIFYFLKYDKYDFLNELVKCANSLGGKDNITALLISRE